MPLEEYQRRRDFARTPEPAAAAADAASEVTPAGEAPPSLRFVVHKHAARALHYDFRLELDGVLLSWAIPKGPSLDTHDKRLAVHVEDHPLDYGDFEGTIPEGEYGGGAVLVWDRGTWEPVGDPHAGLAKGDFKFDLFGEKLHGRWVLVRLRPRPGDKRDNWLLIKEKDEFVRPAESYNILAERPESTLTGRTIEQVAEGGPATAGAATPAAGEALADDSAPATPAACPAPADARATAPDAAIPTAIDVELAMLVETAPSGLGWIAEAKYDGYRMVIVLDGGRARAFTRSHADWSDRFASLARAAEGLPAVSAILDGEAVVFDGDGVSRFELLQEALGAHPERLAYAAFDLLYLNGHDLRDMPLTQRKELLRTLLADEAPASPLRYADHVDSSAQELYAHACSAGLEGVVCKRAHSRYLAGRGRDWQKVKCRHTQELVVGGFTEGQGSRGLLGSLMVGTYEDGRLVYSGRVGSGFDEAALSSLSTTLTAIERKSSPFETAPHITGHALHWVEPTLVIEAAFREWTSEGVLRQPVFLGVREDKDARDVVRERAQALPAEQTSREGDTEAGGASVSEVEGVRRDYGTPTTVLGVRVTNPEKPLFPDSEFPKLSLAEYYAAIAPTMLPHVAERPLTLVRCPVGHGRACFYQRHPDAGLPSQIRTLSYALTGRDQPDELLFVDSAEGLVALAQMGALEVHTWMSRVDAPARPDQIVFDLDPGPDVTWAQICSAARIVREECEAMGLVPFVKSTGSKGLHVTLPIEPVWEFVRVRALAKAIVDRAVLRHPSTLTGKMAKDVRGGRVFLDYLRNAEGASAVAPYSSRNKPGPACAVPLEWDELADDLDIRAFTPERVIAQVSAGTDPWSGMAERAVGARALRNAEDAASR